MKQNFTQDQADEVCGWINTVIPEGGFRAEVSNPAVHLILTASDEYGRKHRFVTYYISRDHDDEEYEVARGEDFGHESVNFTWSLREAVALIAKDIMHKDVERWELNWAAETRIAELARG